MEAWNAMWVSLLRWEISTRLAMCRLDNDNTEE